MTNDLSLAVPLVWPQLVWDRQSLMRRCQVYRGYKILEIQGEVGDLGHIDFYWYLKPR